MRSSPAIEEGVRLDQKSKATAWRFYKSMWSRAGINSSFSLMNHLSGSLIDSSSTLFEIGSGNGGRMRWDQQHPTAFDRAFDMTQSQDPIRSLRSTRPDPRQPLVLLFPSRRISRWIRCSTYRVIKWGSLHQSEHCLAVLVLVSSLVLLPALPALPASPIPLPLPSTPSYPWCSLFPRTSSKCENLPLRQA